MAVWYLGFNAVAYVLLGLWCALAVDKTAASVGYQTLNDSGRCEYTTIYGGLQLALGILFALAASQTQYLALGLFFAVVIYASLCTFRLIGLLRFWPVASLTLGFAAVELVMLLLGLWLLQAGA